MAYTNVTEENQKFFDSVLEKTSIPQWIEFTVLSNDKLKELYKVQKQNDLVEFLTEGINIAVIFNEEIFDSLPEDLKILTIEEALAGVVVSDSDKISIEKPDFTTYTGILSKFGDEEVIRLKETVKSLFDQKKAKDDQAKAEKAAKKKGKKVNNED